MWIYETLASLTYAFIDFITFEILLAAIFTFDENNNIKITLGKILGDTKYKKTTLLISVILVIVPISFFISNHFQNIIVGHLVTLGWKAIPAFTTVLSLFVFWTTKVMLSRRWDFKLVRVSLIILFFSLLILAFF